MKISGIQVSIQSSTSWNEKPSPAPDAAAGLARRKRSPPSLRENVREASLSFQPSGRPAPGSARIRRSWSLAWSQVRSPVSSVVSV